MCDVAYALLVEQFEGDGRAAVSTGGSEHPPQFFRELVDQLLTEDAAPASRRPVSAEEQELREALGVA